MQQPDPAPALGRGIALLRRLELDGPSSLEALARGTGWPKASVLRLLTCLCLHGVTERNPADRRYALAQRLVPIGRPEAPAFLLWRRLLAALPPDFPHTLELHVWSDGRLTMVDRREPVVGEVCVRARIGWQRNLDEFDCLSQLAHAFARPAPTEAGLWFCHEQGRRLVARPLRERLIQVARDMGCAADLGANPNGVVRCASAILAADGGLEAAIAVAQVATAGHLPLAPGFLAPYLAAPC